MTPDIPAERLVKEGGEMLLLKCPGCGQVAEWEGYPADPQLSLILCLQCDTARPGGAFKRVSGRPAAERGE